MTPIYYWAAGFVDGEGCITVHKNSNNSHILRLQVDSTTPSVLGVLHGLFGGRVNGPYNRGQYKDSYNRRPIWVWSACGKEALSALEKIEPYLLVKREQAQLALSFPPPNKRGPRIRTSEEVWNRREEIRLQLQVEKRL